MGCGHSKINIYPKKCRSKVNSKKSVTSEKTETENEEAIEAEMEKNGTLDEIGIDGKKTIKVKPFGGPLLAQSEISTSQQNFFKMLDEKIENGPDYDSDNELEHLAEAERLKTLLKDWETASGGSRSLPATPKRKPRLSVHDGNRTIDNNGGIARNYNNKTNNNESVYSKEREFNVQNYYLGHAAYASTNNYNVPIVSYRQCFTPMYLTEKHQPQPQQQQQQQPQQQPSHPGNLAYASAMQYQAISPMYAFQQKQYPSYNQHGSPIKSFATVNKPISRAEYGSPTYGYHQQNKITNVAGDPDVSGETPKAHHENETETIEAMCYQNQMFHHHHHHHHKYNPPVTYSPSHKIYGTGVTNAVNEPVYVTNPNNANNSPSHNNKPYPIKYQQSYPQQQHLQQQQKEIGIYSNGELIQQQIYAQQLQCQQQREYQQYKQSREQVLLTAAMNRNQTNVVVPSHIQNPSSAMVETQPTTELHCRRQQYEMT